MSLANTAMVYDKRVKQATRGVSGVCPSTLMSSSGVFANGVVSLRKSHIPDCYQRQRRTPMNKLGVTLLLIFVLGLVVFATWQLFAGNLEASFSTFPFLLITYLFVLRLRRSAE